MKTKKIVLLSLSAVVVLGLLLNQLNLVDLSGRFKISMKNKPDLTVSAIYLNDSGHLSVDLENIGAEDVSGEVVTTIWQDGKTYGSYYATYMNDPEFLKVGGKTSIEIATVEDSVIEVCVDYSSLVKERNESNNCLEEEIKN